MKNKEKQLFFKFKWRLFYVIAVGVCIAIFTLSNLSFNNNPIQADSNKTSKTQNEPQAIVDVNALPQTAQTQIAAALAEKASRTPAQQKMDSSLVRASKEARGAAFVDGISTLRPLNLPKDSNGNWIVDIKVTTTDDTFQQRLGQMGVTMMADNPQYKTLRAKMPMTIMENVANMSEVLYISPALEGQLDKVQSDNTTSSFVGPFTNNNPSSFAVRSANVRNNLPELIASLDKNKRRVKPNTGTVNSQGDTTHRAATARTMFSTNGSGIKIGVLSDSFNSLGGAPTDVTTGNLPGVGNPNGFTTPVTVLQDTTGTDEGRAMLQIVHDIAPGAQLFYATAFGGVSTFASNIQALRTAGCDIIIDDVFYFNESPFQDAPIAQAVNTVTANGALYFSSAGNAGSLKKSTAGVWEGDFVSGGTLSNLPGGTVNNFTPTSTATIANVVTSGSGRPYTLFWSDPLGASNNDYDFFIFNSTLTTLFDMGTSIQNGTQDPFEITAGGSFTGDRVVILKKDTAAVRALHLNTNRGQLSIATIGQTKGHSAAVNAFSCAATPTGPASAGVTGPFPNPFSSANLVENFSSDGPRRVFYTATGTAITPGNLLFGTNGGTVRQKPDITAADGVSTTLAANSGLNPFFGTSAAAPHAGAIAALVKAANPSLTTSQIRAILTLSAIDIEGSGVDNNSGFGILDAFSAVQATQGQATVTFGGVTVTEGIPRNNNGALDPGERGNLAVKLNNPTTTTATTVSTTLALTPPVAGVTINNPTINVGSIAATSSTTANFSITLAPTVTCGTNLAFTLTTTFTGIGSPLVSTFNVQTGRTTTATTSVTTVLDATVPPTNAAYTATTGTQTGRLLRNNIASSCATPKTFPGLQDSTIVRRYDSYVFTNTTGSTQCYTVKLTQPTTTLFTLAYNNSGFIPATPGVNYAADPGGSGATTMYSFNVPAGQKFTVVVHEVNANGGLNTTYTLAVSSQVFVCDPVTPFTLEHNSVFAADTANNRIQRTDNDGTTWATVGFGPGTGSGQFNAPRGISSSGDNMKLFVADTGNNRIQRSTNGGTSWQVIAGPGTATNTVNQPSAVAYDEPNDKLYIADTANNRILVVTAASTASPITSVFASSTAGAGLGQFIQPRGVAVDVNGIVYVADSGNNRIQMNSSGMGTGWSVFSNATAGTTIGKMNQPRGIYIDSSNNVYVADTANNRIQVNAGGIWSVFMGPGTAAGSVNAPEGVTKSASGNIFIGDTLNNRVQKKLASGGTATIVGQPGLSLGQFNTPTGLR